MHCRHFSLDTAWNYHNQQGVGWAIGNVSGAAREELFITTKIPCVGSAQAAVEYVESDLLQLQVAEVDLVLIHSPGIAPAPLGQPLGCWGFQPCCNTSEQLQATWAGLELALARNLTRAIGVSNFRVEHLDAVAATATTLPAVNQCQMFVGRHDDLAIRRSRELGVLYEAYSPLGPYHKPKPVLSDKTVAAVARAHNVSSAVVGLRWIVQQGLPFVTASSSAEYDIEDISRVFEVQLTPTEMVALSKVNYTAD